MPLKDFVQNVAVAKLNEVFGLVGSAYPRIVLGVSVFLAVVSVNINLMDARITMIAHPLSKSCCPC